MDHIRSEEIRALCRKRPSDFTRIYKFPWFDVLLFLIFRSEKDIPSEISKFFSTINRSLYRISRQAAFKALKKIDPEVFPALLRKFSELFYSSDLVKTFKGYVLWAEDGTALNLYKTDESLEKYGFVINQNVTDTSKAKKATSRSSALYDVTNGLIVNFIMDRFDRSEIPMAIDKIKDSADLLNGRKAIYLADRYYGGVELFAILEQFGFKYCIRAKSNFFKKKIAEMKSDDEWIEVTLDKAWLKRLKDEVAISRFNADPTISIRVVKISYEYIVNDKKCTEELIYFTNLDKDEFNSKEIASLYAMRWQIETSYKTLKTDYEWERYFSKDCDTETCAIWGKVIFHNIVGIVRKCLDDEFATYPTTDHIYATNIKQLSKMFHDDCVCRWIRNANIKRLDAMFIIIDENKHKIKVPIRPGRHFKRWGRKVTSSHPIRFRLDGRNHPNVVYAKGTMRTIQP